jgi:glycosyltransferase involved in cell wall biosynthesis
MNYKKVAFITEDIFGDSVGGVEQHIFHVAKNIVEFGYEVKVFSLKVGSINSRHEEVIHTAQNGCSLIAIRIVRKNIFVKTLELLERKIPGIFGMAVALAGKLLPNFHSKFLINEINTYSPSIVHQHDYLANIFASKILSKKYPVIFTNHTGQYLFLEKNVVTKMLQKKLISHYKAIIGPSLELTPEDVRATYITNGVDIDFFSGNKYKNISNKFTFICPRRWAPTKGVIYLVQAMKLLPEDVREKVVFIFAGSSSDDYPWYRDEIIDILNTLPKEMFCLLGNLSQDDLKNHFLKSDVVVIPSLMEATSLAAMEGMAAGLPVLSTNVGGMPDVVVNKDVGWLVNPEDANALAEVIKDIANLKYNLHDMGHSAKQFVVRKKSWKKISSKVIKIYENILSKEF